MARTVNKILASTRMSAAIWAGNNKPMIDNKPILQIGQLVAAGIGFNGTLPISTTRDICKAAGIKPKERTSMAPLEMRAKNGARIRRLAVHLKTLYAKLGEPVPADLVALSQGHALVEDKPIT